MKIPSSTKRARGPLQVEMTPMIDVVFLLLIFFLWTASFRIAEQMLPSRVRDATTAQLGNSDSVELVEEDFETLIVRIGWVKQRPEWQVNGNRRDDFAEVSELLTIIHAIKPDVEVIVDPEPAVPFGYVIDAYDLTRRIGFGEVQFAVE